MLKINEQYYPSINVFGEWYFIIKKDNKLLVYPNKPQKGFTLDKATAIENEYKSRIYDHIVTISKFANKLVNEPIEDIIPETKHEESILQYLLNKCKKFISRPTL